jgi:hypothetical protein
MADIKDDLRDKSVDDVLALIAEQANELANMQKLLKTVSVELGKKYRSEVKPKKKKRSTNTDGAKRGITQDDIVPEKLVKVFHLDTPKKRDKSMFTVDDDDSSEEKKRKNKVRGYYEHYDEHSRLSRSGITCILFAHLRAHDLMEGNKLKLYEKSSVAEKLRKIFLLNSDDLKSNPMKINTTDDDGEKTVKEIKNLKKLNIKHAQTLISRAYNSDEKWKKHKEEQKKKSKSKKNTKSKKSKDKKDKKKKEDSDDEEEEDEEMQNDSENDSGNESNDNNSDNDSDGEVVHELD